MPDIVVVMGVNVLILSFAVFLVFFADPDSPGMDGRMYRCVCDGIPRALSAGMRRVCGERFASQAEYCVYWIANRPNRLMQGFYMVIVNGSFICFIFEGFSRIPNEIHPWPYHTVLGYMVMAACIGSFALACNTSPGVVMAAIHCSMLWYGTVMLVGILRSLVIKRQLMTAKFYNKGSRKYVRGSYSIVAQYVLFHYGRLSGLLALAATMAIVLSGFLAYHCYLTIKGTTTNESAKWSEAKDFHERLLKAWKSGNLVPPTPPAPPGASASASTAGAADDGGGGSATTAPAGEDEGSRSPADNNGSNSSSSCSSSDGFVDVTHDAAVDGSAGGTGGEGGSGEGVPAAADAAVNANTGLRRRGRGGGGGSSGDGAATVEVVAGEEEEEEEEEEVAEGSSAGVVEGDGVVDADAAAAAAAAAEVAGEAAKAPHPGSLPDNIYDNGMWQNVMEVVFPRSKRKDGPGKTLPYRDPFRFSYKPYWVPES